MATLLDIVPELLRGTVMVMGAPLDIQALTTIDLAKLMRRFPGLLSARAVAGGQSPSSGTLPSAGIGSLPMAEPESASGGPDQLEALPGIIAAGTGHSGDDAHEAAAARLSIADQINIVAEIMKLTMPEQSGSPLGNGPAIGQGSTAPVNGSLQQ